MRQLSADASKSLIALIARSEAIGDRNDTSHMSLLYVLEDPVLLNVPDKLSEGDVMGVWQGAVLDKRASAADSSEYAVKKRGSRADDASLSTCEMENLRLSVPRVPFFLDHNCARAPLAEAAQLIPQSSEVLLTARRCRAPMK